MLEYNIMEPPFSIEIKGIENKHILNVCKGWGNGYILLPKNHIYHGVMYDDIEDDIAHGGFTYSEKNKYCLLFNNFPNNFWVLGFDTAHYGDTPDVWTKEAVKQETIKLAKYYDQEKFYKKEGN